MQAGFEKVYSLVEKARLAIPVNTKALDDIRDEYGYELYKDALASVLENHSLGWLLAERLNDFYKDFDFYDYMDKLNGTEEDAVMELVGQLEDSEAVSGILDVLLDIRENGELNEAQRLVLDELVLDLSELQVGLGKSVQDVLAEALERSDNSKTESMTIDILQVKHGDAYRDFRFMHLDWLKNGVNAVEFKNYEHIYRYFDEDSVDLGHEDSVMDLLEKVYTRFNVRHPEDFTGHSLSTSDVVILANGKESKAYYCDWIGFKALPEKFLNDFEAEKLSSELNRELDI